MAQNAGRMIAVLMIIAVLTQYAAVLAEVWEVTQCKQSKFDIKEVDINCGGDPCMLSAGFSATVDFSFIATQGVVSLEFVETYLKNSNSDHVYAMAANNQLNVLFYNDTRRSVEQYPLQEGESYFVQHKFTVPNVEDIEKAEAFRLQMFSNNLSSMEMCFIVKVQVYKKKEDQGNKE